MGLSAFLSTQVIDTTTVGRSVMTAADAAAARTAIGAGTSSFDGAFSSLSGKPTTLSGYGITDAQPLDSDLTAIAALTTTTYGRSLLTGADAAETRTTLGLGTLATQSGTFSGTSSGTNTGDQSVFGTIAVSGQSNVVADQANDTLTLVAGTNVTITTDATTDTITITASGGSPAGSSGQIQYNNAGAFGGSSSLTFDSAVGRVTVPSALLAGNISTTAWTTAGVGLSHTTRTLTDTSSTGTVAASYVNVLGANTVAASSSVTYTDCATLFVGNPSAGTNVTITNGLSMITQGDVRIGGSIRLGSSTNGIYFSPTGNSQARISYFGSDFYIDNVTAGGSLIFRVSSGNATALTISSGSVATFSTSISTPVITGSSNVLDVRNGTSAQTLNVYETYTSATSFGRLQIKATSTQVEIGQGRGSGGGSDRPIVVGFYGTGSTITAAITVATTGVVTFAQTPIIPTKTPASAAATGTTGEICWDSSYIYICTATNTWKRAALATW